jgi:ubiquinone/menaquinone biosynthesis C-methylase UbiE
METKTVDYSNLDKYPDVPLNGRLKLAIKWFPEKIDNLLDGGCSFGYGTRYFAEYCKECYGAEINPEHFEVAKNRFKNIKFFNTALEQTPFEDNFFDVIVLNDVLEHTTDQIQTLSEMNRILKSGGVIIISTPHKGLFQHFDPYNYGYYLKKYFNFIYSPLYKTIRFIKTGKFPTNENWEHGVKHYHYNLDDFKQMLDKSTFKNNYKIDKVFRSALVLDVLFYNLERIFDIFMPLKLKNFVLKPFFFLAEKEYWIQTGILANNIALRIIKK